VSKFAARFGRTRQDLADSPELHWRVMVRYAKEHGHDPTGLRAWVMVVSHEGDVAFYPYWIPEDPDGTFDRGWTDRTPLQNPPELLEE
jgi:hypothetical protein